MRPGKNLLRAATICCLVALLVPAVHAVVWIVAAMVLVMTLITIVEWGLLRGLAIRSERPTVIALPLGEIDGIPFTLTTNSERPVQLRIRQVWPLLVDAPSAVREARCGPGEVIRFEQSVRAVSRGSVPLRAPAVAATMWSFLERILISGEDTELTVIPNTRAVGRLHQQLNAFILRGLGSRVAPRLGKGREFDRLRDYVQDDDFRDVAWPASAKHNKLIVREYRLDRSQEIILCLDRGHRMAARVEELSRFDHAVNAALLLAYVCNRMEDRVGVLSFADTVERGLKPARGTSHLRQMTAYLTPLQPQYHHTDYLAVAARLRRMLRQRTLILLLTALPEPEEGRDLIRAVGLLAPQHLPLVVILSDPGLERAAVTLPGNKHELSRALVARELWHDKVALVKELRQRGALVVESTPQGAPVAAVNAYIDVKRRQLL